MKVWIGKLKVIYSIRGGYMVLKTKKYKSKENLNLRIYTFVFGNN